jgi:hypothetical protein
MKAFQIGKLSCTLLMFALTSMMTVGSPAAHAQSCVTAPPQPSECYLSFSVQSGQFGWNWPPRGSIPQLRVTHPLRFSRVEPRTLAP